MSLSDCPRCWETPCGCPGSRQALAETCLAAGYSAEEASQDPSQPVRLAADLQALADMRTLDDWAARNSSKLAPATAPVAKPENPLGWTTFLLGREFDGATPDAARAKAAAWVRGQAK